MKHRWHSVYPAVLAACISLHASGASIAELQAAGRLRISSSLAPNAGVVPGQHVELALEIATDSWFAGGTRIVIPEVQGLVIVQSEQFATNASETREGKSWVIQRWVLDVFAQRDGEFTIGPVAVHVRVNAGDKVEVAGTLFSAAEVLQVAVPDSLAEVKRWVAAPTFTVSQSFDRPLEALAVGDAFEQQIRFEATDVLAMMLPEYPAPRQAGLAAYPAPPTLDTSSNRGETLASRSQRISYVIEQPGQFLLPARDFYWWNTQRAKLTVLTVPQTRIEVAGAADPQPTLPGTVSPKWWHWALLALVFVLTAARLTRNLVNPSLPRPLLALAQRLRLLFRPALATRLNPGSNDGE